jgi:CBS domain-containing protein
MTTCAEIMTQNPKCHGTDATVNLVAKTMRDDNVGSVPIVESLDSMRLVGMITDRDIAIYVVAEDRDTTLTAVKAVMTASPAFCNPETDISEALKLMEELQIRRIPVVDSNTQLVGIIAQADIATRLKDPEMTAEVVEKISEDGAQPRVRQAVKD